MTETRISAQHYQSPRQAGRKKNQNLGFIQNFHDDNNEFHINDMPFSNNNNDNNNANHIHTG